MKKRIVLFASDLAACIGRNKYQSRKDMLYKYLARYDAEKHKSVLEKHGEKAMTEAEVRKLVLDSIDTCIVREAFEDCNKDNKTVAHTIDEMTTTLISNDGRNFQEVVSKTQKALVSKCMDMDLSIPETLRPKVADLVRDEVRKRACTDLGTAKEQLIATSYAIDNNVSVCKDDVFVKKKIGAIVSENDEAVDVFIGGKCDGIVQHDDGSREIIEIKNRTRRLFRYIPDYELVQVYAYMHVLDIHKAKLVERFRDERYEIAIKYEEDTFEQIRSAALEFSRDLLDLSNV